MELDYAAWKVLAGIDSIEYYRFIYPQDSIYRFSYLTQGSITQFAPFVVNRGVLQPIHVIYLDGKPVYFSWSTNVRPYSFNVDRGYHQIKLRTAFREITIDSLYFEKGKKMIFSLEQDLKNPHVKINEVDSKLSDFEKRLLYKYIVPYRHTFGEKYAFLKENENFQSLTPESRYGINNYAGSLVGDLTFQLVGGHSTRFRHEPFFEYEFSHGLLKMRSADKTAYPEHLYARKARSSLADNVLTPKIIEKQWRDYLDFKRSCTARYRYPNFTPQGAGKLLINLKRSDELVKEMPLNILIFRYDNHEFLRVYPGNTSLVHDLKKGYHKLLFFYSGAKYHV